MRTKEIKIYQFQELSDESKEKAIEKFREMEDFAWSSEYLDSLEAGLKHFGFRLKHYEIDWSNINYCDTAIDNYHDQEILGLTGVRLYKYIVNNFLNTYCKYSKKNVSVFDGNCAFTGVSSDEDFLDPINEFLKKPSIKYNFEELIEECVHSLLLAGCNDFDYQISDKGITENIEANGYEFYENGKIAS